MGQGTETTNDGLTLKLIYKFLRGQEFKDDTQGISITNE